MFPRSHQILES